MSARRVAGPSCGPKQARMSEKPADVMLAPDSLPENQFADWPASGGARRVSARNV